MVTANLGWQLQILRARGEAGEFFGLEIWREEYDFQKFRVVGSFTYVFFFKENFQAMGRVESKDAIQDMDRYFSTLESFLFFQTKLVLVILQP